MVEANEMTLLLPNTQSTGPEESQVAFPGLYLYHQ